MLRVIIISLLIVSMAMIAAGSVDYDDDVMFDYLTNWIAEVQGNLSMEVGELRRNLTIERQARAKLQATVDELSSSYSSMFIIYIKCEL